MIKVDEEVLWNICKDTAKAKYGLLYVEANAEDICRNYSEKLSEIKSAKRLVIKTSISKKDIQNLLGNTESIPNDIQIINEGVYFIPVVFSDANVKERLIKDLQTMFNQNIVVSDESIRKALDVSFDESVFFISELLKNKLIDYVVKNEIGLSYYSIGSTFKEHVKTDTFANALLINPKTGLITKSDLDKSTEINLTTPIMQYFEQENLLCRLGAKPNKYLVVSLKDKFAENFMHDISSNVQERLIENNFAMTEATMMTFCAERLNELYGLDDADISEYIVAYVNSNIAQYLAIKEKQGKNNEIFVDDNKLRDFVSKEVINLMKLPKSIENGIMKGVNGQEVLKIYISDKVSVMNMNKDKVVDDFIKNEIIKVGEETIINSILPTIPMAKGDSDE